jgi:sigma-54 specific flagellar transcriptional regulator A
MAPPDRSVHLIHDPSSPLSETVRACARIAQSDATVLLTGETGTGKEVFARFVHDRSTRAHKPFVPVNCGAIPEALLESELFGYTRGAFTGALTSRKGRVAMADGGTLFLDEIGELPLVLQVKLLRVLQERSYEPLGSTESVPANFRLVAATNRNLVQEVEAGRFRRDLYYRLLVCPVELPALRERRADITTLFLHFWKQRGETRPIAPAVLKQLQSYDWPGNVRELENLVERLAVCSVGPEITWEDLPAPIRPVVAPPPPPPVVRFSPELPETAGGIAALLWAPLPGFPNPVAAPPPVTELPPNGLPFPPSAAGFPASPPPPPAPVTPMAPPPGAMFAPVLPADLPDTPPSIPPTALFAPVLPAAAPVTPTSPPPMALFAPKPPAAVPDTQPSLPPAALFAPPAPELPMLDTVVTALTREGPHPFPRDPVDLQGLLRRLEDAFIDAALERAGGNKKAAADLLGLQRTTLVEKLRRRERERAAAAAALASSVA